MLCYRVALRCFGSAGPNARVAPVDRENKLFVGMLPHDADDMTLTEVFSVFGEITEVSPFGRRRQRTVDRPSAPHEACTACLYARTGCVESSAAFGRRTCFVFIIKPSVNYRYFRTGVLLYIV